MSRLVRFQVTHSIREIGKDMVGHDHSGRSHRGPFVLIALTALVLLAWIVASSGTRASYEARSNKGGPASDPLPLSAPPGSEPTRLDVQPEAVPPPDQGGFTQILQYPPVDSERVWSASFHGRAVSPNPPPGLVQAVFVQGDTRDVAPVGSNGQFAIGLDGKGPLSVGIFVDGQLASHRLDLDRYVLYQDPSEDPDPIDLGTLYYGWIGTIPVLVQDTGPSGEAELWAIPCKQEGGVRARSADSSFRLEAEYLGTAHEGQPLEVPLREMNCGGYLMAYNSERVAVHQLCRDIPLSEQGLLHMQLEEWRPYRFEVVGNGQPLEGARLVLGSDIARVFLRAAPTDAADCFGADLTDSQGIGTILFTQPVQDRIRVHVNHPAFSRKIVFLDPTASVQRVELSPLLRLPRLRLSIVHDGQPVPHATVRIDADVFRADDDGSLELAQVSMASEGSIRVDAPGFVS